MRYRSITSILAVLSLFSCVKPENPGSGKEKDDGTVEISFSLQSPEIPVQGEDRHISQPWPMNPQIRLKASSGEKLLLNGSVSPDGKTASFEVSVNAQQGVTSLRGAYPSDERLSVPYLQLPSNDFFDTAAESLSISASLIVEGGDASVGNIRVTRPLGYVCFTLGDSFRMYSAERIRYVVLTSSGNISGEYSVFLGEVTPSGNKKSDKQISLNYDTSGSLVGGAKIWAVMLPGSHAFSSIEIVTDQRKYILGGRTLEALSGKAVTVPLELYASDRIEDFNPTPEDDVKDVYHCAEGKIAGPAHPENFYCLVNGHSYSPYTLRYLDPFTLKDSNPNGWSTSSANKLAGSEPLLSVDQYNSVYPYIMFYVATNTIYGPASRYSAMQFYSYDSMLFVSQMGTPAIQFRRLSASGDETTVAKWTREGSIISITTSNDGTVMVKSNSGTVTKNFKVDKTSVTYDASSTDRDRWKEGDVIMLQHLGRSGKTDSPEYLGTGLLHIRQIDSDGYDPSTGGFKTMDHHARLKVSSYWEKR